MSSQEKRKSEGDEKTEKKEKTESETFFIKPTDLLRHLTIDDFTAFVTTPECKKTWEELFELDEWSIDIIGKSEDMVLKLFDRDKCFSETRADYQDAIVLIAALVKTLGYTDPVSSPDKEDKDELAKYIYKGMVDVKAKVTELKEKLGPKIAAYVTWAETIEARVFDPDERSGYEVPGQTVVLEIGTLPCDNTLYYNPINGVFFIFGQGRPDTYDGEGERTLSSRDSFELKYFIRLVKKLFIMDYQYESDEED